MSFFSLFHHLNLKSSITYILSETKLMWYWFIQPTVAKVNPLWGARGRAARCRCVADLKSHRTLLEQGNGAVQRRIKYWIVNKAAEESGRVQPL